MKKRPRRKSPDAMPEVCPTCGRAVSLEDWAYYGECPACSASDLPLKTAQMNDSQIAVVDIRYHGDRFHNGEW